MANDFITVADMVADALNLSGYELSEVRNAAPVLATLPAVQASDGDYHRYSVYTGAPAAGFRAENAGRDFDHSTDTIVNLELKILDWSFQADKAVADRWRAGGAQAWISKEGLRHLRGAMFQWEQQLFQGTGLAAAGFNGFPDSAHLDKTADAMVVDGGGDEADKQTSCYLLRVNPGEISAVYKGDSFAMGETIVTNFVDGSSKNLPVYYTPACSWVSAQMGSLYSKARICNINNVEDSNPLSDDLIYKAISLFPAGHEPNLIVMNRAGQEMLRKGRTATNVTGAPATIVDNVAGIPVVTTDAILSTEAVVAAS